ncbi:MAG: prepilin-type N-terminal cleavage/methylation domain-containing protein [Gammaproteobacteria bacterium]|nr:prepilin-type N-terminal cleavage/methylation domain-containing protein [Gammaproteobacteria bacterium]
MDVCINRRENIPSKLRTGYQHGNAGFSFLELLITLALISLSLSMTLPSFSQLSSQLSASTTLNQLKASIKYAKSEAVNRGVRVRLCASKDGQYCDPSGQWEHGWIVYLDIAGKSARTETDPILKIHGQTNHVTIRKNGRYLTVSLNATGQISLNRSFYICRISDRSPLFRLTLIHSGQLRVSNTDIACP